MRTHPQHLKKARLEGDIQRRGETCTGLAGEPNASTQTLHGFEREIEAHPTTGEQVGTIPRREARHEESERSVSSSAAPAMPAVIVPRATARARTSAISTPAPSSCTVILRPPLRAWAEKVHSQHAASHAPRARRRIRFRASVNVPGLAAPFRYARASDKSRSPAIPADPLSAWSERRRSISGLSGWSAIS